MAEKLTEEITCKVAERTKRFAQARAAQMGLAVGEYIRHLIEEDRAKAASDLNLLAEALGAKVTLDNGESR